MRQKLELIMKNVLNNQRKNNFSSAGNRCMDLVLSQRKERKQSEGNMLHLLSEVQSGVCSI